MKTLTVCLVMLVLGGCASAPRPQMMVLPSHKAPIVKAAPAAAVEAPVATPNDVVKKRWYSRFKVHPRWFHQ